MYAYGGEDRDNGLTNQFSAISFDADGNVEHNNINTQGPQTSYSKAVVLQDNSTVVIFGGFYADTSGDGTDPMRASQYSFSQNAWSALPGTQVDVGATVVPPNRQDHTATLASDGRIYICGGDDLDNESNRGYFNDLWMLDTQTYTWHVPSVTGIEPKHRSGAAAARVTNEYIIFCFGLAQLNYFNTIDVLKTAEVTDPSTQEVDFASAKWVGDVTTGEALNEQPWGPFGISGGVIAAVVVVCALVLAMILYLLYRFRHRVRRTIMRIHYGIWNPRTGEPLWAETARLISKVVLLFLFVAFFVFVIIQVLQSPKASYIVTEVPPDGAVEAPDIRFCFEGFSIEPQTNDRFYPLVGCMTGAGDWCGEHLTVLDLTIHSPRFIANMGNRRCYLFTGDNLETGETLHFASDTIPQSNNGSDMQFTFWATDPSQNGRIHISFYPSERDPNRVLYLDQPSPLLDQNDLSTWLDDDNDDFQAGNTVDLEVSDYGYLEYQLERTESLLDKGWNYVGFAPVHNATPKVTTTYRVQSRMNGVSNSSDSGSMLARIIVSPASFATIVHREQKIYSLVNAVGFVGGLLGLFVAFQAIMFGYRPRSPFGIVHRWSVGSMRNSISSGLKDRFDLNKTPVPLVNPVHKRYSFSLRNYGPRYVDEEEETYIDDLSSVDTSEQRMATATGVMSPASTNGAAAATASSQIFHSEEGRRLASVEDRMQLLELVFKSYYVDDEVFRRLDVALKRPEDVGNRASRRSFGDYFRARPGAAEETPVHPAAVPVREERRDSDSS
ncbi:hypothetical protein BDB00DRAFT_759883 [Zychaea mexicana]|uniref:uncharacterized protein n=1 Tax=Zychaea mexicana TaxID=64656 RepID=UPI0022FEC22D|nr:uncharacterized protein BDB00DRAFT_759883 [Zychaea mexicana]KAI9495620.1 hypothetical protein BDB00DRAFT_759883 [Zychaea mexicana]